MMEIGSMPDGPSGPRGVLWSVKTDHAKVGITLHLYRIAGAFSNDRKVFSVNFGTVFRQLSLFLSRRYEAAPGHPWPPLPQTRHRRTEFHFRCETRSLSFSQREGPAGRTSCASNSTLDASKPTPRTFAATSAFVLPMSDANRGAAGDAELGQPVQCLR